MTWDEWYYEMCIVVGKNSKCLSRHIGAVLVKDKSIVSTGYNGPPRGLPHCGVRHQLDMDLLAKYKKMDPHFNESIEVTICPRYILGFKSGEGLEWCVAGHAERNALINAARTGVSTKGCTLYMDCQIPCKDCLIEIINAGIDEIVVTGFKFYDQLSKYLLKESSLKVRIYEHLK